MAGHGGRRKGAGRPPKLGKAQRYLIGSDFQTRFELAVYALRRHRLRGLYKNTGLDEERGEHKKLGLQDRREAVAMMGVEGSLPNEEDVDDLNSTAADAIETIRTVRETVSEAVKRKKIYSLTAPSGLNRRVRERVARIWSTKTGMRITPDFVRRCWSDYRRDRKPPRF